MMQLTDQSFRKERQPAFSRPKPLTERWMDAIKCLISAYTCYQPDSLSLPAPSAQTWRYGHSIHEPSTDR